MRPNEYMGWTAVTLMYVALACIAVLVLGGAWVMTEEVITGNRIQDVERLWIVAGWLIRCAVGGMIISWPLAAVADWLASKGF